MNYNKLWIDVIYNIVMVIVFISVCRVLVVLRNMWKFSMVSG